MRLLPAMQAWKRDLLSIPYPCRCFVCGSASRQGSAICSLCACSIERPFPDEVRDSVIEFFPDCPLQAAFALWVFEKSGALQPIHHAIKYANQPFLGDALGGFLGHLVRRSGVAVDVIVPIPLHRLRLFERGYNQSRPIADGISAVLSVPVEPGLLRRTQMTRRQTGLSALQRAENLRDAFAARAMAHDKSVLLVDDVITSGATMNAAAGALLDAGASSVSACAIGFARR